MNRIRTNLWFDTEAEDAARFYAAIFKESKIGAITYYGSNGTLIPGKSPDLVATVEFELNGQSFLALNGGPQFTFNRAISLEVECVDQAEVDYYWERLSVGGDPTSQQCGWLTDKYGVAWQVVPQGWQELIVSADEALAPRIFDAVLQMKKLNLDALHRVLHDTRVRRAS